MMPGHIHLPLSVLPHVVSRKLWYLKGKSAMMVFRRHANLKYRFENMNFWAARYYASALESLQQRSKIHTRTRKSKARQKIA